jgi:L-ascorbate metabolism protein UlaG (beta-lactamase superfamily)
MAEFRWFGHNCFRIRAREATILTDPVGKQTAYAMPRQTADIVTISHDHPGHANLAAVKPGYQTIAGPGEYELSGVFITGIRTYHDGASGAERGYNTAYLIEVEGMIICHLGDLGHPLTPEQTELMTQCDILLIPAGGGPVITPEQAADIVTVLEPKLVIPMQYATAHGDRGRGPLEPFITALGASMPEALDKLTVRASDLSDTVQVVALLPDGQEGSRP